MRARSLRRVNGFMKIAPFFEARMTSSTVVKERCVLWQIADVLAQIACRPLIQSHTINPHSTFRRLPDADDCPRKGRFSRAALGPIMPRPSPLERSKAAFRTTGSARPGGMIVTLSTARFSAGLANASASSSETPSSRFFKPRVSQPCTDEAFPIGDGGFKRRDGARHHGSNRRSLRRRKSPPAIPDMRQNRECLIAGPCGIFFVNAPRPDWMSLASRLVRRKSRPSRSQRSPST